MGRRSITVLMAAASMTLPALARWEATPPVVAPAPTGAGEYRPYIYPGFEDALEQTDWDRVGELVVSMTQHLADYTESLHIAGDPFIDADAVQRRSVELRTLAEVLGKRGVPGSGPTASFTHPVVAINAVGSALDRAGLSLGVAQQKQLFVIGLEFAREDEQRRARVGESTPRLRVLIDEADLRGRFFHSVDCALTPRQRRALHPGRVHDLTAVDLFSAAFCWAPKARLLVFEDRAELAYEMTRLLGQRCGIDPARLREPVADWLAGFDGRFLQVELTGEVRRGGLIPLARERQLALQEAMLSELDLSEEQRRLVLGQEMVLVPYLLPRSA